MQVMMIERDDVRASAATVLPITRNQAESTDYRFGGAPNVSM